MIKSISKIAILVASGLLVLAPVSPIGLNNLTGIAGIIILLSSTPYLGSSYKKPVYVFSGLSLFLFVKYQLSFEDLINGVNSMLAIAGIVAVLQLFAIPIKVGNYDRALEKYLQTKYKKEVSLYVFLNLVTHVLGSFMLFGSVPMLFTIFYEPLNKMVHDPKRFITTAMGRSFSLVTLWAPGAINVVLVLEVTGAKWLQVLFPVVFLTILGLGTSVLMEAKFHLKDRAVQIPDISAGQKNSREEDNKKFRTLILIAVGLIVSIVVMENLHILTGTTRVIASGLVIVLVWISRYLGKPDLHLAWRQYWEKSIVVAQDLATLFIAMGIFAEAVYQAGLISYIQPGLISATAILGQYSFLFIPLVIILLSLIGIHPFISIILIGKMLVSALQMPHYETFIALSLLLGGVVSYMLSPFAGNILALSRMANCTPSEVGYKWNGLFSLVFMLEGFVVLLVLQMIW